MGIKDKDCLLPCVESSLPIGFCDDSLPRSSLILLDEHKTSTKIFPGILIVIIPIESGQDLLEVDELIENNVFPKRLGKPDVRETLTEPEEPT